MNKNRVLSIIGAVIGFLISLYSFLGLYMVAQLSNAPDYTIQRKQVNILFWTIILVVSFGTFIISLSYLWFSESRKRQQLKFNHLLEIMEFHEEFIRPIKGIPRGCWNLEINELEKYFGYELPVAYRQYLKFMGKDYNGIFVGSNWFIDNVIENTRYLPELLTENKIKFVLPKNYLAFFSHQGYMIAWFELPKLSEDPPVWFFTESEDGEVPKIIGTFTEVVLAEMRGS